LIVNDNPPSLTHVTNHNRISNSITFCIIDFFGPASLKLVCSTNTF